MNICFLKVFWFLNLSQSVLTKTRSITLPTSAEKIYNKKFNLFRSPAIFARKPFFWEIIYGDIWEISTTWKLAETSRKKNLPVINAERNFTTRMIWLNMRKCTIQKRNINVEHVIKHLFQMLKLTGRING